MKNPLPRQLLPSRWNTLHLIVTDSTLADIPELQQINDAVPQTQSWTHVGGENEACSMLTALEDGVLPPTPDRSKAYFRMQSIRLSSAGKLIGFLAVYHGFPQEYIFWINAITFATKFQGQGYGPELLLGLSEIVRHLGSYTCIRSYVALNNVHSLKLCVKTGFNKMVEIAGEKVDSDINHTHMLVEKTFEVI